MFLASGRPDGSFQLNSTSLFIDLPGIEPDLLCFLDLYDPGVMHRDNKLAEFERFYRLRRLLQGYLINAILSYIVLILLHNCFLALLQRLLNIGNDIVNMLDAD